MEELIEHPAAQAKPETDLVTAVRDLLSASPEPLTLSKIRAALPPHLRPSALEELADSLQRQVAANVLFVYPKYRSAQDRYWDRPMKVHLACLVRALVEEKPLSWSEIRRKLPEYARSLACPVLEDLLAEGTLHRHPPTKGPPRFGLHRPDPKIYLRPELERAFARLEKLGLSRAELRQGAIELLHHEEWGPSALPQANQT